MNIMELTARVKHLEGRLESAIGRVERYRHAMDDVRRELGESEERSSRLREQLLALRADRTRLAEAAKQHCAAVEHREMKRSHRMFELEEDMNEIVAKYSRAKHKVAYFKSVYEEKEKKLLEQFHQHASVSPCSSAFSDGKSNGNGRGGGSSLESSPSQSLDSSSEKRLREAISANPTDEGDEGDVTVAAAARRKAGDGIKEDDAAAAAAAARAGTGAGEEELESLREKLVTAQRSEKSLLLRLEDFGEQAEGAVVELEQARDMIQQLTLALRDRGREAMEHIGEMERQRDVASEAFQAHRENQRRRSAMVRELVQTAMDGVNKHAKKIAEEATRVGQLSENNGGGGGGGAGEAAATAAAATSRVASLASVMASVETIESHCQEACEAVEECPSMPSSPMKGPPRMSSTMMPTSPPAIRMKSTALFFGEQ